MNNMLTVCCLLTAAVLLRLLGYQIPFMHNFEARRSSSSPIDRLLDEPSEPEAQPTPQNLPPEDPVAADFERFWSDIN